MTRLMRAGLLLAGMSVIALHARAEPAINNNGTAFAVGGYDVVAYFTDQRAVRGKPENKSELAGATWLFATPEHKALFDKEPNQYLPAYFGYCAYGVSRGYLVKIAPEAFTVRAGKLYLNYSLDVRRKWLSDPEAYIKQANRNWPQL
jgi:YHS domain-containing protein